MAHRPADARLPARRSRSEGRTLRAVLRGVIAGWIVLAAVLWLWS
jgi:fatty acid desaturase